MTTAAVLIPLLIMVAASPCFAQSATKPSRPADVAVSRIHPRQAILENLAREVGIDGQAAKGLLDTLEDKGFPLQEAVMLVLLARTRADQLVAKGQVSAEDRIGAIRTSLAALVEQVDRGTGWGGLTVPLALEAGQDANMPTLMRKARAIIGGGTVQARSDTRSATADKERVRQPDVRPEPALPRDTVHANIARELSVDVEAAKRLLGRLERELPLREAVILLLLAKAQAEQMIAKGRFSREQRLEAIDVGLAYFTPLIKSGAGWGDLGREVQMSGFALNVRANAILGQQ